MNSGRWNFKQSSHPLVRRTQIPTNSLRIIRWGTLGEKYPVSEEVRAPDHLPFFQTEPDKLQRLEAVLFLAQEPISSRKLSQLADTKDGTQTRKLLKKLNEQFDVCSSAFRVYEIAGGFQLRTRSQFSPWLCRLHEIPVEVRLSVASLETLSVIAYKQPVLRATVEKIRGVQCGEMIRQLLDQDLVRIIGKSEELGRPFLYGTTKRFLQIFGLNHLGELPKT